jgi:hypothetical protein
MKFPFFAVILFTYSTLSAQNGKEVPLYKGQIPNSRPAANKEGSNY